MMRHARYVRQWSHSYLYVSESVLLAPSREDVLLSAGLAGSVFTALASHTCGGTVVLALTSAGRSDLTALSIAAEQGNSRVLCDSSTLGEDLWFGDAMSLSLDGRWLLATVRPGRGELFGGGAPDPETLKRAAKLTGTVYLIDCLGLEAPRAVGEGGRLLSAAWSPAGGKVACELERPGEATVMVLNAETGQQWVAADRRAYAVWSIDGEELRLLPVDGNGRAGAVWSARSGECRSDQSSGIPFGADSDHVWSEDRSMVAWVEQDGEAEKIGIGTATRPIRTMPAAGVGRLLGWSCGGQILAYADEAGSLQLCSGAGSDAALRMIEASGPPRSKHHRDRPGGLTLATSYSPVKLAGAAAAWARDANGLALVYVVADADRRQSLAVLRFKTFTLNEIGVDLSQGLREQTIRQVADSNLITVYMAVRLYAQDHGGRYPPHASGHELAKDLEAYGNLARSMGSAYAPDEHRVQLLYPGGTRQDVLRDAAEAGQEHGAVLELRGDDGLVFHMYSDGGVWMTPPNGMQEVVSSWE